MRIAVLAGGRSSEHDVSLASAASVRAGLARAGHDVVAIHIQRDGVWEHEGEALALTPGRGLLGADAAFPALHGPYGEDGTVQGLLECLDVPYVGAGVLASAVCMDKVLFKELMGRQGLAQVDYVPVTHEAWEDNPDGVMADLEALGLPVFAKPVALGSSLGIARAGTREELRAAVAAALAHDRRAIVEAAAPGLEVECSVMGNQDPVASLPGEIVLPRGWYDYEAKYTPGGMELVVPARISATATERVRELAVAAFRASECCGLARVDFFVDGDDVLLNELNTMPGFTETSVFGKLFAASGVSYEDLLERLVGYGLERHAAEREFRH